MHAQAYQLRLVVLMLFPLFWVACSGSDNPDDAATKQETTTHSAQVSSLTEDSGAQEADSPEKTAAPQEPPAAPQEELGEPPRLPSQE